MENSFVNIHSHQGSSIDEITLVNTHEGFSDFQHPFHSIGLHPWFLQLRTIEREKNMLSAALQNPAVKAIGECGLDRVCATPWALQLDAFRWQLSKAEEYNLPVIIHCVRAQQEVLTEIGRFKVAFVFHGFNRNLGMARQILAAGGYLSFNLTSWRDGVGLKDLPLSRVFLETDDQVGSIQESYKKCSIWMGCTIEDLKKRLYQNTIELGIKWNRNE